ncbi:hypothetical protein QYF36_018974 [Acer negundo]|nr:hypothetical protein QYF36_018974 [Acer negundo]
MSDDVNAHFQDFLLLFFRILKREEVEILCVMLWRVWYWRNQFIHSPSNYRKKDVFGWASSFLCDYQGANQVTKTPKMKSIAAVPILWSINRVRTELKLCKPSQIDFESLLSSLSRRPNQVQQVAASRQKQPPSPFVTAAPFFLAV